MVVLAQGNWSYFIAQTCLLYSQKMNSCRKKSSGAPFHELSLFAAARKKIARMQKCGKKSFTTKIQVKQWLKLFYFLHWIIIKYSIEFKGLVLLFKVLQKFVPK